MRCIRTLSALAVLSILVTPASATLGGIASGEPVERLVESIPRIVANPGEVQSILYESFVRITIDNVTQEESKGNGTGLPFQPLAIDADHDSLRTAETVISLAPALQNYTTSSHEGLAQLTVYRSVPIVVPADHVAGIRVTYGDFVFEMTTVGTHSQLFGMLIDTTGLGDGALAAGLASCGCRPGMPAGLASLIGGQGVAELQEALEAPAASDATESPDSSEDPYGIKVLYNDDTEQDAYRAAAVALQDADLSATARIYHQVHVGMALGIGITHADGGETLAARFSIHDPQPLPSNSLDVVDVRFAFAKDDDQLQGSLEWHSDVDRRVTVQAEKGNRTFELLIDPMPASLQLAFDLEELPNGAAPCAGIWAPCDVTRFGVPAASRGIANLEVRENGALKARVSELPPTFTIHAAVLGNCNCSSDDSYVSLYYEGHPTDPNDPAQRPDLWFSHAKDGQPVELELRDLPNVIDDLVFRSGKSEATYTISRACSTSHVTQHVKSQSIYLQTLGGLGSAKFTRNGTTILEAEGILSADIQTDDRSGIDAHGYVTLRGGGSAVLVSDYVVHMDLKSLVATEQRSVEFDLRMNDDTKTFLVAKVKVFDQYGHLASIPRLQLMESTAGGREVLLVAKHVTGVDLVLDRNYKSGELKVFFDETRGGGFWVPEYFLELEGKALFDTRTKYTCWYFDVDLATLNGALSATLASDGLAAANLEWKVDFSFTQGPENVLKLGWRAVPSGPVDPFFALDADFYDIQVGGLELGDASFGLELTEVFPRGHAIHWEFFADNRGLCPSKGCFDGQRTVGVSADNPAATRLCVKERITVDVADDRIPVVSLHHCYFDEALTPYHLVCESSTTAGDCGAGYAFTAVGVALLPVGLGLFAGCVAGETVSPVVGYNFVTYGSGQATGAANQAATALAGYGADSDSEEFQSIECDTGTLCETGEPIAEEALRQTPGLDQSYLVVADCDDATDVCGHVNEAATGAVLQACPIILCGNAIDEQQELQSDGQGPSDCVAAICTILGPDWVSDGISCPPEPEDHLPCDPAVDPASESATTSAAQNGCGEYVVGTAEDLVAEVLGTVAPLMPCDPAVDELLYPADGARAAGGSGTCGELVGEAIAGLVDLAPCDPGMEFLSASGESPQPCGDAVDEVSAKAAQILVQVGDVAPCDPGVDSAARSTTPCGDIVEDAVQAGVDLVGDVADWARDLSPCDPGAATQRAQTDCIGLVDEAADAAIALAGEVARDVGELSPCDAGAARAQSDCVGLVLDVADAAADIAAQALADVGDLSPCDTGAAQRAQSDCVGVVLDAVDDAGGIAGAAVAILPCGVGEASVERTRCDVPCDVREDANARNLAEACDACGWVSTEAGTPDSCSPDVTAFLHVAAPTNNTTAPEPRQIRWIEGDPIPDAAEVEGARPSEGDSAAETAQPSDSATAAGGNEPGEASGATQSPEASNDAQGDDPGPVDAQWDNSESVEESADQGDDPGQVEESDTAG